MRKISNRRKTIHDGEDNSSETFRGAYNPRITEEQEDILIEEILKRFDIIENKRTDKSLSSKKSVELSSKAWEEIHNEFKRIAKVSDSKMHLLFVFL